jgi:predicted transcriptional regulator
MKKSKRNQSTNQKERRPQLTRQDYDRLKRSAWELVVVYGKDQKEVAGLLNVSEQSISKWANEDTPNWHEQRQARQSCFKTDTDNVRELIRLLTKNRLDIEKEIQEAERIGDVEEQIKLRKQARGISDEISKNNKTLLSLDKENKYTLGEFTAIMDDIFNDLRAYNEDLFYQTVDFQSILLRKKINELG